MNDEHLESLTSKYQSGKLCLFTGAGVSFTEAKYYKAPGWWDLLLELYHLGDPGMQRTECISEFQAVCSEMPDPWDVAEVLVRRIGGAEAFVSAMRRIVIGRTGRDLVYKRLPIAYLRKAETLNAVVSFCSRLRAIRHHPCYEPNPRIPAVLTLNYDWFLEGGATQKHNAGKFKSMARANSKIRPGQLPVYHLHGYLPFEADNQPDEALVLTRDAYEQAYADGGCAVELLEAFCGSFPTLFIGISFTDELLLKTLRSLAAAEDTPIHYAFMLRNTLDRSREQTLRESGVLPILLDDPRIIPEVLGALYKSGLQDPDLLVCKEDKSGKQVGTAALSKEIYWSKLLSVKR